LIVATTHVLRQSAVPRAPYEARTATMPGASAVERWCPNSFIEGPIPPARFSTLLQEWKRNCVSVRLHVSTEDHDTLERFLQQGFSLDPSRHPLIWNPDPFLTLIRDFQVPTPTFEEFLPRIPEPGIAGDDGVLLTCPRLSDLDDLCVGEDELAGRPYAIFKPRPREVLAPWLGSAFFSWRAGPSSVLIVRSGPDERPMAKLTVRKLVPPGVLDVGYATLAQHRGGGVAARAVRTLTRWLFTHAWVQRIEMGIKPDNRASLKTATTAGYDYEGTRRSRLANLDGTFSDEWSYVAVNG